MTSGFLFLCFAAELWAASVTDIAAKAFGRISQDFQVEVVWPLANNHRAESILYGNSVYGFFRTKRFTHSSAKVALQVVPPGYRHQIDFFVEMASGERQKLGSKRFESPIGEAFSHLSVKQVQGRLSTPFLAVAGALPFVNLDFSPPESHGNAAFVYVVNRIGEVVWIHIPDEGRTVVHRAIELQAVGDSGLALYASREGIFETVSFDGKLGERILAPDLLPVSSWRRGFAYDQEEGLLVASEGDFFERQWPKFWLPPRAGEAALIQKVDGKAGRIATVWNTLNYVWPRLRKKARKEKIISLDRNGDGEVLVALEPSGKIIRLDRHLKAIQAEWQPRDLSLDDDESAIELLHVRHTKIGLIALYSDGSVWKCSSDCSVDARFEPWLALPTGMPLARGRVVWQRGDTVAFYGVQAPFHSFRRRTVRPDLYWEWDGKAGALKTEWEIGQHYYSPAVGAVGLMHLSAMEEHGNRSH